MYIWPSLTLDSWRETLETLHMWTQIIGKIRLKLGPNINHWWGTALYVNARGLTTSAIPYDNKTFEMQLDFVDHTLKILTSEGACRNLALVDQKSVSFFYKELMNLLQELEIYTKIDLLPKEIQNPISFDQDDIHHRYDSKASNQFWIMLLQADRLMKKFRSHFTGKCSPVHFFWGSFDLAVTRFSGRPAPFRPNADHITQVAYSHEVYSCGFWPGGNNISGPAFYAYAAPEPIGFQTTPFPVTIPGAFYNIGTKGFVLPIEELRKTKDPDQAVLAFFQATYELAANLGKWDRENLEKAGMNEKIAA